jgi:hypothetical protein
MKNHEHNGNVFFFFFIIMLYIYIFDIIGHIFLYFIFIDKHCNYGRFMQDVIMKKFIILCSVEHFFNIVPTIKIMQVAYYFFSKVYNGERNQIVLLKNLADLIKGTI